LVNTEFKSGGLHEKHVEATWKGGNHLSIRSWTQGNQKTKTQGNQKNQVCMYVCIYVSIY